MAEGISGGARKTAMNNRNIGRIDNQHTKDFIKIIGTIKPSMHIYNVFDDWLIFAAAALYSWKKDEAVEAEYAETAKRYTPEELQKHGDLLAITVNALEEKEQDFLGDIFTTAQLTNSRTGQFFTPYHISYMMAKMTIEEQELSATRVYKVGDPCCGAGGMLIAAASVMKDCGVNYQQNVLFIAQDIDARCARMAFIQLSLLGVPAVITCGDSLTADVYWQRETIGYHLSGMDYRIRLEHVIDQLYGWEQTASGNTLAEEKPAVIVPVEITMPLSREYAQGELF
jgi:hypothetical protein